MIKILCMALFLQNCFSLYGNSLREVHEVSNKSIISRDYLDIIETADTIIWYLLDPMSTDTTYTNKHILLGEILSEKPDTLGVRLHAIKNTLSYPASFYKEDLVKECTFLPDIAILFRKESLTITFYYSFYCDVCRFERDGKYQETNGERIRKAILQMACEIFSKDRYLRLIKRRDR